MTQIRRAERLVRLISAMPSTWPDAVRKRRNHRGGSASRPPALPTIVRTAAQSSTPGRSPPETTMLYDRSKEKRTFEELERIVI